MYLLRLGAVLTMSAFAAVLLPFGWMAEIHRGLGMGELPAAPVVDYLARSLALFYGFHGGLLLVVSLDVRRFRPLVVYLAAMNLLLGAALVAVDLHAGMPAWWTVTEGPPVVVIGALLLYLVRAVPKSS